MEPYSLAIADGKLVLTRNNKNKSVKLIAITLVGIAIVVAILVAMLLAETSSAFSAIRRVLPFLLTAVLPLGYLAYRELRHYGETFILDRTSGELLRNSKLICPLKNIAEVQLVSSYADAEYTVALALRNVAELARVELAHVSDNTLGYSLADEVARYLGLRVIWKR